MKRSPERVLRLKVAAMRKHVRLRLRWPDGGADALAEELAREVPDTVPSWMTETEEEFAESLQAAGYCLDGSCGTCGACRLRGEGL